MKKLLINNHCKSLFRLKKLSFCSVSDKTISKPSNKTLFFDFQSTTPIDPRVLDRMMPYMTDMFGNPHSKSHSFGWEAEEAMENSRKVIS